MSTRSAPAARLCNVSPRTGTTACVAPLGAEAGRLRVPGSRRVHLGAPPTNVAHIPSGAPSSGCGTVHVVSASAAPFTGSGRHPTSVCHASRARAAQSSRLVSRSANRVASAAASGRMGPRGSRIARAVRTAIRSSSSAPSFAAGSARPGPFGNAAWIAGRRSSSASATRLASGHAAFGGKLAIAANAARASSTAAFASGANVVASVRSAASAPGSFALFAASPSARNDAGSRSVAARASAPSTRSCAATSASRAGSRYRRNHFSPRPGRCWYPSTPIVASPCSTCARSAPLAGTTRRTCTGSGRRAAPAICTVRTGTPAAESTTRTGSTPDAISSRTTSASGASMSMSAPAETRRRSVRSAGTSGLPARVTSRPPRTVTGAHGNTSRVRGRVTNPSCTSASDSHARPASVAARGPSALRIAATKRTAGSIAPDGAAGGSGRSPRVHSTASSSKRSHASSSFVGSAIATRSFAAAAERTTTVLEGAHAGTWNVSPFAVGSPSSHVIAAAGSASRVAIPIVKSAGRAAPVTRTRSPGAASMNARPPASIAIS
ncbi:MAG: hypothetical protein U0441_13795 [Polyangiaceae bacterium]